MLQKLKLMPCGDSTAVTAPDLSVGHAIGVKKQHEQVARGHCDSDVSGMRGRDYRWDRCGPYSALEDLRDLEQKVCWGHEYSRLIVYPIHFSLQRLFYWTHRARWCAENMQTRKLQRLDLCASA